MSRLLMIFGWLAHQILGEIPGIVLSHLVLPTLLQLGRGVEIPLVTESIRTISQDSVSILSARKTSLVRKISTNSTRMICVRHITTASWLGQSRKTWNRPGPNTRTHSLQPLLGSGALAWEPQCGIEIHTCFRFRGFT